MPIILVLLVRSWGQSKAHQVRDRRLSLPAMWILHAEYLSFCILIQCPKFLSLLVLGFAGLRVAGCGSRASVAAAAGPTLGRVV